jgi:hypothetical protein
LYILDTYIPDTPLPLPETIRTKITSESAGYISLTPVEQRDIPFVELVERILALTGKNPRRIHEILERGSLISGPARYRWEGIQAGEADLAGVLARFPDAEPQRPFDASKCRLATLRSQRSVLELSREAASLRRLFKRQNFWDVLLPAVGRLSPRYERYSYAERADVYTVRLSPDAASLLRSQAPLLKYSALAQQLQMMEIENVELIVER